MHTILGAGGPVSNALTHILQSQGQQVRLISRRPVPATGTVSWAGADLKDYPRLLAAAKGSSVLYLTAGLKYDKKVWRQEWPVIMDNVVRLAQETGARLIFFDNVYMYGRVEGAMTEDTPYRPVSVKGEIRAGIATKLMEEAQKGNIRASIARSADFYGAPANSFFDLMVLQRLAKGGKAQWLGNPGTLHSFTYVPDAARGVALLGSRPDTDNRIWHLPTAPAMTGREFIGLTARVLGVKPGYMSIGKTMLQAIGLFNPVIGETAELYYQYAYDYRFDSSRFEQHFGIRAASYEQGIREAAGTVQHAA